MIFYFRAKKNIRFIIGKNLLFLTKFFLKKKSNRKIFREDIHLPKIKVNDINMYYEIHGDGFPFVMIAGMGASLDSWTPA